MIRRVWGLGLILLAASSARAADPPKLWAIVIGIDAYDDANLSIGLGARGDARAVRDWLVHTASWPGRNVLVMDDRSQEKHFTAAAEIENLKPTKANLDWAVKEWLPYRAKPGDMVLIYFGGQAIGGLNTPNSHDLLLPIDARAAQLETTGWNLPDALDILGSKGENPILVMLDTSLSGRAKPVAETKTRRTNPERFLGELTRWPGTAAWIAASNSPSTEAKAGGRSPFVETVLSALGTAERPINVLGSLFIASRNPTLSKQGFRAAGALGPSLALWPKLLADAVPPDSEFLLQRGHADRVKGLIFSADGSTMISSSEDSSIKVWRTADRTLLRTLPGHMIGVTAMAMSPDGTKLASGDGAGRVLLWSLADYKARRGPDPIQHLGGVTKIVFLGDGSSFASIDIPGRVILWKLNGKKLEPTVLVEKATAIAADGETLAVAIAPKTAQGEPILQLYVNGKKNRELKGLLKRSLPDALAMRGDRIVAGDRSGLVLAWKATTGEVVERIETGEPVTSITLSEDATLVGSGDTIRLAGPNPKTISLDGPIANVVVSADGKSAAAVTDGGKITAWTLPDAIVKLETKPNGPKSLVLGFPPHSDRLVSGDQDGGVRYWEWPTGALHSRIVPGRGKIETLASTDDGQTILQIDHDRLAKIWKLGEARGVHTVPGQWVSGTFTPDGHAIALTTKTGEIVLVDAQTLERKTTAFSRPVDPSGAAILSAFGPLAVSPDGKFVAAGSREAPVVAVWSIDGGKPKQTILDHDDSITAIQFASDSAVFLTGSLDGTAKIWSSDGKPLWVLKLDRGDDSDTSVTAARLAPGPISTVVTGHRDGRIVAWKLEPNGKATSTLLLTADGPISSLEFVDQGKRLIVGGWDRSVRIWTARDGVFVANDPLRLLPQHTERVQAVLSPPGAKYLASAGDDGAIRFWKPDGSALLGTISTSFDDGTWVAFDPKGHFDSAPGGEVHVSFLEGSRVVSLDQSSAESRIMGLGGLWLGGTPPAGESSLLAKRPVGLAIDPPIATANADEVELKIHLGDADATELRLYQNDIPVRTAEDFQAGADPGVKTVKVRLGAGENRFVAMAARPEIGSIHGRSNSVLVRGPVAEEAPKGIVFVLALGVSEYDSNALQFAHSDASELAKYLERNGLEAGRKAVVARVFQNKDVKTEAIERALIEIRDACKPEDTVVVFLAGHTDVRRDDRFCLLLDKFPFAPKALEVGMRGPIETRPDVTERDVAGTILPYATIYRTLSRMNARNRLVVIDACQAGAIFDDPSIQRIQRKTEDAAHETRTSYLLASRKGESAAEAAVLKHGLMTYLLLLGMGAKDLEKPPGGDFGVADADGDRNVSTEELRQYLDINLPILATRVAAGIPRANPNGPAGPVEPLKSRGGTTAFPVARLPKS